MQSARFAGRRAAPPRRGRACRTRTSGRAPEEHDPQQEAHVAELRHPEGLDRRPRGRRALVVEADQEVGAEAHQLPEDEELEEVRREDEPQHREREERLVEVVAPERGRRLVGQVAERVELDQPGDQRHQGRHRGGQRVHVHADRRERRGPGLGQPGSVRVTSRVAPPPWARAWPPASQSPVTSRTAAQGRRPSRPARRRPPGARPAGGAGTRRGPARPAKGPPRIRRASSVSSPGCTSRPRCRGAQPRRRCR